MFRDNKEFVKLVESKLKHGSNYVWQTLIQGLPPFAMFDEKTNISIGGRPGWRCDIYIVDPSSPTDLKVAMLYFFDKTKTKPQGWLVTDSPLEWFF